MSKPASTTEQIRQRIEQIPPGQPFTPEEFLAYGTRAAVDQAISRLIKANAIMRVSRGIYCRPVTGRFGRYGASPERVVALLEKSETIQVHGARAANIMGLSTQVPMQAIYMTSGRSRTLRVGNRTVKFRHSAPRKLLLADRRAGVALTAMWYLGKGEVTHRVVGAIRRELGEEEFEVLKSVMGSMPAWMRSSIQENEKMVENSGLQERLKAGQEAPSSPPTIPATSLSPLIYIGGMAALNLPSPTGTGDWHMMETFFRPRENRSRSFISGEGCPTNTNSILGDEGIYDCTAILDDLGIPHESPVAYAADHARATADLVLAAVLRGCSPEHVVLDDWMPRDGDKEAVLFLLEEARPHLTAEQQKALQAWELKNSFSYKIC